MGDSATAISGVRFALAIKRKTEMADTGWLPTPLPKPCFHHAHQITAIWLALPELAHEFLKQLLNMAHS